MRKYICFSYQKDLDYSRIRQWLVELTSAGILTVEEANVFRQRAEEWLKEAIIDA